MLNISEKLPLIEYTSNFFKSLFFLISHLTLITEFPGHCIPESVNEFDSFFAFYFLFFHDPGVGAFGIGANTYVGVYVEA